MLNADVTWPAMDRSIDMAAAPVPNRCGSERRNSPQLKCVWSSNRPRCVAKAELKQWEFPWRVVDGLERGDTVTDLGHMGPRFS